MRSVHSCLYANEFCTNERWDPTRHSIPPGTGSTDTARVSCLSRASLKVRCRKGDGSCEGGRGSLPTIAHPRAHPPVLSLSCAPPWRQFCGRPPWRERGGRCTQVLAVAGDAERASDMIDKARDLNAGVEAVDPVRSRAIPRRIPPLVSHLYHPHFAALTPSFSSFSLAVSRPVPSYP